MKHSPKNWLMVGFIQLGILVGSFNLPNSIINGNTWYAPLIDFGRIASLFGFPVGDTVLAIRLLAIGRRKKEYIRQFIDAKNHARYDTIEPINFISITEEQIQLIELAYRESRNDLIFDTSFPYESLQKYITGTHNNA
jgi:hypothetical protein